MSIDVFGRHLGSSKVARGPPGIGFNLTKSGDFDLEKKRLCNVADPIDKNDALNLSTWDSFVEEELEPRLKNIEKQNAALGKKFTDFEEEIYKRLEAKKKSSSKKPGSIESRLKAIEKILNINRIPDSVDRSEDKVEINKNESNQESSGGGDS